MDEYTKLATEYSTKVLADAEKERRKEDHFQNRFNYYSCIISTLAFILSIIALFK